MTYEYIFQLQEKAIEWKLLRAKNAPLILGFMFDAFRKEHALLLSKEHFVNKLADYLEFIDNESSCRLPQN